MEELERAKQLLAETAELAKSNIQLNRVCQKLSRKIKADIHFLEKLQSKSEDKSSSCSSNIPYLSGVLEVVKQSDDVQEVICDMRKYGIIVDVVCNGGKTWKKVVARNPQSLHLIWAGKGQYGTKDVVKKAEKYLNSARLYSEVSTPQIVCIFCNGVTYEMAAALESKGIAVKGERISVSQEVIDKLVGVVSDFSDSEDDDMCDRCKRLEICPAAASKVDEEEHDASHSFTQTIIDTPASSKVFLDITAMLVYISDVCNGGCDFQFNERVLMEQATAEKKNSVLDFILPKMADKKLVTCKSALTDFWSIVNIMGGPEEMRRAQQLTDKLTIVADRVSTRFSNIIQSGQIKERSRLIFGTADMLRCEIMTSNEGFVRAAAAQGIHIAAIIHEPRALSERKKIVATGSIE